MIFYQTLYYQCGRNELFLRIFKAHCCSTFRDTFELEPIMMNLHLLYSKSHEKEQKTDFGLQNKNR